MPSVPPIVPGANNPGQPPVMMYPPPQPKKKSRVGIVLAIILASLVALCIGGVAIAALVGGAKSTQTTGGGVAATSAKTQPQQGARGLNQPVRDGKFEFTVTKVQCGVSRIGTADFGKTAQGQFCKVYLTVKNIGNEAVTFDASSQNAFNAAGQKYDADGTAGIYVDDSNAFLNDINPGNSVNGIVVFDIPKTAQIVRLELHDSPFSDGVGVKLS